jgi:hypothetical protein
MASTERQSDNDIAWNRQFSASLLEQQGAGMVRSARREVLGAMALPLAGAPLRSEAAILQGAPPWISDSAQPPQPVSPRGWRPDLSASHESRSRPDALPPRRSPDLATSDLRH